MKRYNIYLNGFASILLQEKKCYILKYHECIVFLSILWSVINSMYFTCLKKESFEPNMSNDTSMARFQIRRSKIILAAFHKLLYPSFLSIETHSSLENVKSCLKKRNSINHLFLQLSASEYLITARKGKYFFS